MTSGKTIALTRGTFVGKVMSLLLNMLSRLVLTFLSSSKHILISWLQSPSAVILESKKIKSDTVSTVRTGHGTTDLFQKGKGVCQGCILSPCLFNLYAEYIMRNAGLEEAQGGIKIAGRDINNLRYDTTFMAESEEELKSLLMKVKVESEKVGLKLDIQKTKIMVSGLITHGKYMGKQWK